MSRRAVAPVTVCQNIHPLQLLLLHRLSSFMELRRALDSKMLAFMVLALALLSAAPPSWSQTGNPQVVQGASATFTATGSLGPTADFCQIYSPVGAVLASFSSSYGGTHNGWTVSITVNNYNQPAIFTVTAPAAAPVATGYSIRTSSYYWLQGSANFDVIAAPPPSVPASLSATAGDSQVTLSWSAANYAASYKVKRAAATGGPYTTVGTPTTTSYTDTGLINGTTYYYVVSAVNGLGESANSSPASATPQQSPPPTAVMLNTPSVGVNLSWSQNSDSNFAAYKIYRATSPGVTVNSTLVATQTYQYSTSTTDNSATGSLPPGTTYYYKVFVENQAGGRTGSNEVSITLTDNPPAAVTLNAPSTGYYGDVSLSWSGNYESDFQSYRVYRATTPGVTQSSSLIATLTSSSSTSTSDYNATATAPPGTRYYYRVFVVDQGGQNTGSNEVSILRINNPPGVVTLNTPVEDNSYYYGNSVALSWSQSSGSGFASYQIYRGTAPGVTDANGTLVTTITYQSTTSTNDSNATATLPPGTTYYYILYVVDNQGQKTPSNEVSILRVNNPPTAVTLDTPVENRNSYYGDSVGLSWSQSSESDFASYKIYRATAPGVTAANATLVTTITSSSTVSYNDSGATASPPPGTTYYYKVFVVDSAGQSTGSNEQSIVLVNNPPVAVTLNTITILNDNSSGSGADGLPHPKLSWTQSAENDFVAYKIYRSTQTPLTLADATLVTTITDRATLEYFDIAAGPTPAPGTTYYYRVYVVDSAGQSTPSNEKSVLLVDAPPTAVVLDPPVPLADYYRDSVQLKWTFNTEPDFKEYQLYRATHPGVTRQDDRVAVLDGAPYSTGKWEHVDNAPSATGNGITYFYKVYAVDKAGQATPSNEESVTMIYVPTPEAPETPQISNVTQTSLLATMPGPHLPTRATSLTLQIKLASAQEGSFAAVPNGEGLQPDAQIAVTGLTPNTDYHLRCVAVGTGGSTPGPTVGIKTGTTPPPAHGPPNFVNATTHSIEVPLVTLQTNTTWLDLQMKIAGQSDAAYRYVALRMGSYYGSSSNNGNALVNDLLGDVTYTFRFIAVGPGGSTAGPTADWTVPLPDITWEAGGAIQCGGIEWPLSGMNIQAGTTGKLNAFLATDWDFRQESLAGTIRSSWYSDTCRYSWQVVNSAGNAVGTFPYNRTLGQSVPWIAPNVPGTYTVMLAVDDQGAFNQPAPEGGTRDDAYQSYNDDPVKFSATINVVP